MRGAAAIGLFLGQIGGEGLEGLALGRAEVEMGVKLGAARLQKAHAEPVQNDVMAAIVPEPAILPQPQQPLCRQRVAAQVGRGGDIVLKHLQRSGQGVGLIA